MNEDHRLPLIADYDGGTFIEPVGLRQPEISRPLADTLRDQPGTSLIAIIGKAPFAIDALFDLCLIFSDEQRPDISSALIEQLAMTVASERDALRTCAGLLANHRFELACVFALSLVPRATNAVALSAILNLTREWGYRNTIEAMPCHSEEAVFALCKKLSELSFRLYDSKEPLLAKRLLSTSELSQLALGECDFSPRSMSPAQPCVVGKGTLPERPVLANASSDSGGFVKLRDVRLVGSRPHLFYRNAVIDDVLSLHADPAEFTPYGDERIYYRYVYHYAKTIGGDRWAIVRNIEPTRTIARGILLHGPYQANYWHLLAEHLILLPAIAGLPEQYSGWPLIVSRDAFSHPNLADAINRTLAISNKAVEVVERDEAVRISELLVPPRLAQVKSCLTRAEQYPADIMLDAVSVQQLHDWLALPNTGRRRFFLARSYHERLANQDEVRRAFERRGFETIYPERLTFEGARALFADADVIAGPTGAAFTNLLLCPRKTLAIVFIGDFYAGSAAFSSIAEPLGQRVVHIPCPTTSRSFSHHFFSATPELVEQAFAVIDAREQSMSNGPKENTLCNTPLSDSSCPLVSILIPAYKARWFEQALRSALEQDYPEKEIVVFDNCPTEDIRKICEKYPTVRYWRNPNTRLQNILDITKASRGRYIKHLFDDDLLEPTCVSELVSVIAREPDARLAFAASWTIDENGQRLSLRQQVETPSPVHYYDGNALCRAFARDCGNMIGEFSSVLFDGPWLRESLSLMYRAEATQRDVIGLCDVICFMNAAAGRPVAFVNKPLSYFRVNRESNSNADRNPDFLLVITDWLYIIEEVQARGLLSKEDVDAARNSYNNLAARLARQVPNLADQIHASLFAQEDLPEHAVFQTSESLAHEGHGEQALALLIALAEKDTAYWRVYRRLAEYALHNGDLPLAISFYGRAMQKAVRPIREYIDDARGLLGASHRGKAEALLRCYLNYFPDDEEAKGVLAECLAGASAHTASERFAEHGGLPLGYERWLSRHHTGHMREHSLRNGPQNETRGYRPTFDIFLCLRPGMEALLADTIDSLSLQTNADWRLSIFSPMPSPEAEFTGDESLVRWIQFEDDESMPENVNRHVSDSPAEWIGVFACGTRFAPELLQSCGDYMTIRPEWRLIYTDEDELGADGKRNAPRFKPDFNLELLRSTDYIGGILVEKQALVSVGGYSLASGADAYDLCLRIADALGDAAVGHVPDVLQHVPAAALPRASNDGATRSLREHLDRRRIDAEVLPGMIDGETRRIAYRHVDTPKVSIIIPTRNRLELLGPCVESLLNQTRYPDWELLLVDNGSDEVGIIEYYEKLYSALPDRVHVLHYNQPFDFSAMNNLAAREARGDYLLLLNNDTECIHDDWLDAMMAHAQRPDVGIVGARLLFPDSLKIQHAGVILGMTGTAGHPFVGSLAHDEPGYLNRAQVDQEFSAVTGACLLIRKSVYEEVGGLDEQAFRVSFNDIDLCLKVRQRGYRIIWTPFATLLHHGSATQAIHAQDPQKVAAFQQECNEFYLRWTKEIANDPAWNRNLSLCSTDPAIEDELTVPWNTDFHDRPRILVMPVSSPGAAEYRNLGPLAALHAAGRVHYASVCQPRADFERAPMVVELARLAPDVLVMHAPVDNVRGQALLRYARYNPDVFRIYALDDLITHIPESNPTFRALPTDAITERLELGLKASNRLIVSTEPLMHAYRHLIDDIRLLPNSLAWSTWGTLQSQRRRGRKLRVGWAGAQQHAGDLRFMKKVVAATSKDVDWVFFGMLPEGTRPHVAEFHDYIHDFSAYPAKLASLDLDLAVAPLEVHPFNEAKSNLRLLEYGILGWPVICTDIFPYRTDAPPVTRLPNDPARWIAAIRERVAEPDALAAEGDVLREWVKKHYLLEQRLDQWFDAYSPESANSRPHDEQ